MHWTILHLKACFQTHVWKATCGYICTIKSMLGPPMTALAFNRTISDEMAMWTTLSDAIFLGLAPVRACYTKTIGLRTSATLLALCVMYVCVRVAMWLLMKCVHTAWSSESPYLPGQSLQLLEPYMFARATCKSILFHTQTSELHKTDSFWNTYNYTAE